MKKVFAIAVAALLSFASINAIAGPDKGKSPGAMNIVEIALADPDNFSILVDLVVFAELDGVLSGDGQYTVFAPTNEAFGALIEALIAALGEDATLALLSDKAFVTDVLLYHVTDGRRFANSLVNKNTPKAVEMLNGGFVMVTPEAKITDGSALTSDAGIILAEGFFNISASNGVIHVIDAVLVP